ncbi:GHKL domain-containing protein [Parasedimentitalea marina]|uniref:histidine kinase n=1 Tax=Parasedimentitalea marina TaxID=2483033 RepID=A0A3T0MZG8_9RHOB|nr:ATP-binding protein [Parasedimentitalea marina]AZV77151.1 GHKL domain-containing protein [Parasedimentitalea marina]
MINFAEIIEQVSVPILVVDTTGTVILANKKTLHSFPSIQVGEDANPLWLKESGLSKLLRKTIKTGSERSANMFAAGPVQREYKVVAKILDRTVKEEDLLFVLTFEDRTPFRAAKSMRSDFVANVSHEIKSPLTAISGFVESLQDAEDIDAETRSFFLGMMAKEVTRMTHLVTDLLSLSKVEAKESRALKKQVDSTQVLQQACETVAGLARERHKTLELQIADALPVVLGKHDDLLRVFINLLENAINYSRENSTINLTAAVTDNDSPLGAKAICVAVTDQGDGIPEAEISRLTERFYRVDKSRSRNVGGTGLGLAIVKHILVRHLGKMVIESTPGKGSVFTVYLPVHQADRMS